MERTINGNEIWQPCNSGITKISHKSALDISSLYSGNSIMLRMNKMVIITLFSVLSMVSCEKDTRDIPEGLVHWDILKVTGPDSGSVNDTIILDVYYPTSSGCDIVTDFLTDKQGKTLLIKALGFTSDGFCTQEAIPRVKEYTFLTDEKGEFLLKFIKRDNSTINHYITIK